MARAYRVTERLPSYRPSATPHTRVQYTLIASDIGHAARIVRAGRPLDAWPGCTIARVDRRDQPLNFEYVP